MNARTNLAFVLFEAGLLVWAHAVGVPWLTLALVLAGILLAGVAGFAYLARVHLPGAHRRHQHGLRPAPGQLADVREAA
jgi:UPF0716 family protein affecting phage T7 exclusion